MVSAKTKTPPSNSCLCLCWRNQRTTKAVESRKMAETMLLLWGKNDDGESGRKRDSMDDASSSWLPGLCVVHSNEKRACIALVLI